MNSYTLFASHITIGDKLCTPTLFVPYIVWATIPKLCSLPNAPCLIKTNSQQSTEDPLLRSLSTTISNPHITLITTMACYRLSPAQHQHTCQQVQSQTNKINYKPIAKTLKKNFRSLLAQKRSGKNLCGQKSSGVKDHRGKNPN